MSIARTLVAALAVTALAVPAAQAQPADIHASFAEAAAKAQQKQDLRSPDVIDAAQAAKAQQKQDLRSPDAIDAAQLRGHGAAKPENARGRHGRRLGDPPGAAHARGPADVAREPAADRTGPRGQGGRRRRR